MNSSARMNERTHLYLNTRNVFICNDLTYLKKKKKSKKKQHTAKQTRNEIAVIFLTLDQPKGELCTKIEIDRKIDQTPSMEYAKFLALLKDESAHVVHLLASYFNM